MYERPLSCCLWSNVLAENGSTGDDGSSGDCSNGKLGLPCSDKGSNAGTSGSDEDGNVNGSGSGSDNGAIDPTDATDVNTTDGKGVAPFFHPMSFCIFAIILATAEH